MDTRSFVFVSLLLFCLEGRDTYLFWFMAHFIGEVLSFSLKYGLPHSGLTTRPGGTLRGFPSGHSVAAGVLLGYWLSPHTFWFLIPLSLYLSLARLKVHTLIQVLVGLALGFFVGICVSTLNQDPDYFCKERASHVVRNERP